MNHHPADFSRKRINFLLTEITSLYHDAAVKAGLSDTVLEILYTLCEMGSPCPQKTVYQSTGYSRSTVNSAIRKLEKAGVLYLTPDDRRSTLIWLTEKGQTLMEATARPLMDLENAIIARWSDEEQQFFLQTLERYIHAFRQELPTLYTGDCYEDPTV